MPSFARQSVFRADDAVVERVVRGARLLAPSGMELLEDTFVRDVILYIRRTRKRTEQVDHLLLGEPVVVLDDPNDHGVQVRRREIHAFQDGEAFQHVPS